MNKRLQMLIQMTSGSTPDAFTLYALAMEHRKEGDAAQALQIFGRLRSAFPDYLPQYLMAGQAALELDTPEAAIPWLEQGIQLARESGDDKTLSELSALLDEANPDL